MSGQHPINWGIDSNEEARYPVTETWLGDPPHPRNTDTDEDYSIRDYPEGSPGSVYRHPLSETLMETGDVCVSTGSDLLPPPPPLPPSPPLPLPLNNHDNLGWQTTANSLTTNSPGYTPLTVAHVVVAGSSAYYNADYSDIGANMVHTQLMRDGRSYRQRIGYQEQSVPLAMSPTDSSSSSSSSSSSLSSSSIVVNVGSVTEAEVQDQMQTRGQNTRTEDRKKVKREREAATQWFATDDSRQPTASMAINIWDESHRET